MTRLVSGLQQSESVIPKPKSPSISDSVTSWTVATRLPRPWDSPGKNTGVGCLFLLQCMKMKSESEDAQSCPTLSDPMDRSLPGSSVHGILQARVLEWVAIAFSHLHSTWYPNMIQMNLLTKQKQTHRHRK